jgi:hypothetical protein
MIKRGVLQLALQLNFWVVNDICNSLYLYAMSVNWQVAWVVKLQSCNSSNIWCNSLQLNCNLVKIHISTPNLHCIIYGPHMLMTKKLLNNTIQILCKLINVNNLLYTYANVMQQTDNSSCGVFTIAYATNIVFGFYLEKSQYVLTQMWTHLQNSISNKYIFPFPKYELILRIYSFFKNNSSSLIEWSSTKPKFVNKYGFIYIAFFHVHTKDIVFLEPITRLNFHIHKCVI